MFQTPPCTDCFAATVKVHGVGPRTACRYRYSIYLFSLDQNPDESHAVSLSPNDEYSAESFKLIRLSFAPDRDTGTLGLEPSGFVCTP